MKANKRVAKLHDRVTNLRQNMLHEFTTQVVEGHGIICIEDLNLKGLVQTRLAKSFSDAAIGETIRQLQSKAEAARRIIQRVGRFYPSSQLCSVCVYACGQKPSTSGHEARRLDEAGTKVCAHISPLFR